MIVEDWKVYPNFSKHEFKCRHTGTVEMNKKFMDDLQRMRLAAKFPFIVTSGYRHPTHPAEMRKRKAGEHTYGRAVDLQASGWEALWLVRNSKVFGFNRIGLHQKGSGRFVHLGNAAEGFTNPAIWTY